MSCKCQGFYRPPDCPVHGLAVNVYRMNLDWLLFTLYRMEQNIQISCFWDAGWTIKFGDETNGFQAPIQCDTVEDMENELRKWITACLALRENTPADLEKPHKPESRT